MQYQIFISYRHSDGAFPADLLANFLQKNNFSVFLDKLGLRSGSFPLQIEQNILKCKDFIMLITRDYFSDRIFNSDDWVAKEIKIALRENKNIIPYLIETTMPNRAMLPEDLRDVVDFQACENHGAGSAFEQSNIELITKYIHSRPVQRSIEEEIKSRVSIYNSSYGDEFRRLQIQSNETLEFDRIVLSDCLKGKKDLNILDVGCAYGYIGYARFNDERYAKVYGIDCNEKCIDYAKKNFANSKFYYQSMDIESTEFSDKMISYMTCENIEGFDIIFIALVLHHLADPTKFLSIIRNFLKPNGVIIIRGSDDHSKLCSDMPLLEKIIEKTSASNGSSNRFLGRHFYGLLKRSGYSNINIRSFTTETSQMTEDEKTELFQAAFSYRINTYKKLMEIEPTYKNLSEFSEMAVLLAKLESAFCKDDFWYCHHHYVGIATK